MKMREAKAIIDGSTGFMVSFEWVKGGVLESDYFPDKHAGEDLIATEKEAWELAEKFADKMVGRAVNLYVVNADWTPVKNYRDRYIKNR